MNHSIFGLALRLGCIFLCLAPVCRAGDTKFTNTVLLPGGIPLHMVWVQAGVFFMGSTASEQDAYPDEMPQRPVSLSHGFWLGTHEVTRAQWTALMGTSPWQGKANVQDDDNAPAVYVSWEGASAFVKRLAELTGREFCLPSEAQWEYACWSGTDTRFSWGDDEAYELIERYAWWRGNALVAGDRHAQAAGLKEPNSWGVYDINGNVFEWCRDWFGPYASGPAVNPEGPQSGELRVNRGGSWATIGGTCRSARRGHDKPDAAYEDLGFRVACTADPEALAVLEAGVPRTLDLFVGGREGVDTYRIPALLSAPDSSLLAFCEARKISIEDASPTDLVMRRSEDGGQTWGPMQTLVRGEGDEAVMNPCAVMDRSTATVLLFCIKAHYSGPDRHRHYLLTSRDSGRTWEKPQDISGIIANYDPSFVFGPGTGIQMENGRLVIPGYSGTFDDATSSGYFSRVLYSDDHGQHWNLGPRVPEFADESQVVELAGGRLMLNMRGDMGKGCRGIALSEDGGASWSRCYWEKSLNECPCQAAFLRARLDDTTNKGCLLFSNPDNHGEKFGVVERDRMTVRLSYDEGVTWPVKRLIHPGPSSYSSLVQLPDGDIGMLYEGGLNHRREWIRFVRFSLQWLTGEPEPH